jgi:hypothetical protein
MAIAASQRTEPSAGASRARPWRLTVGPRAYWLLALSIVGAYTVIWLWRFPLLYGVVMDDVPQFLRAVRVADDWRAAFGVFNSQHVYYLLLTYLPLKLGASVPSYDIPILDGHTGAFRFLSLAAIGVHAALLLMWAWFALRLTPSRLAALLSLLLFATSPTLNYWTPKLDSRLLGLPLSLGGLALLLDLLQRPTLGAWPQRARLLVAGSLFGISFSIFHTSAQLIVPACLVFIVVWLWRGWRRPGAWGDLVMLALGGVWLHAGLELVSHFVVGYPWAEGLTATLLAIRNGHSSEWTRPETLRIWLDLFANQFGLPLLLTAVIGLALYLRGHGAQTAGGTHRYVGATVLVALLYLTLSGSMPFFRESSHLQPFLFLFAAVALVRLVDILPTRRLAPLVLVTVVGVASGVPWQQTVVIYQAHQSLGRALDWVAAHREGRPVAWLQWAATDPAAVLTPEQIDLLPPDTLLISHFPFLVADVSPSLLPRLAGVPRLADWPSYYATDVLWAEARGFGHVEFRADPVLSQTEVVEARHLQTPADVAPLTVSARAEPPGAAPSAVAANALDGDRGPIGATAWMGAPPPPPQSLEFDFDQPARVGAVDVVLPPFTRSKSRIDRLEVQTAGSDGEFTSVWVGDGLADQPVIRPRWSADTVTAVRIIVYRAVLPTGQAAPAIIEEVQVPGYSLVAVPSPVIPQLILRGVEPGIGGLWIDAVNATWHTVLVVDGARLPLHKGSDDRWLARAPLSGDWPTTWSGAYLTDGVQRSNGLSGPGADRRASEPAVAATSRMATAAMVVACPFQAPMAAANPRSRAPRRPRSWRARRRCQDSR